MYSCLDEKMPRPLCGHGMTLEGESCPCGRHVSPPRPPPSFHGGNAAVESRRFWDTCRRAWVGYNPQWYNDNVT